MFFLTFFHLHTSYQQANKKLNHTPDGGVMDTQQTLVRWLRSCDVDEDGVDLALAMGLTKVWNSERARLSSLALHPHMADACM